LLKFLINWFSFVQLILRLIFYLLSTQCQTNLTNNNLAYVVPDAKVTVTAFTCFCEW